MCWIADCEICDVPMVVWRHHGRTPPAEAVDHMLGELSVVADARFGAGGWAVDQVMRQIPDHFHAHAVTGGSGASAVSPHRPPLFCGRVSIRGVLVRIATLSRPRAWPIGVARPTR